MYKAIVITDPETADGFRLAGVSVVEVENADEAREKIRSLLDDPDAGILAVNESFYNAIDEKTQEKIDSIYRPIVIPLPIKESVEMAGERRAYLARLIHRAIGFDITLRGREGE
ncbi:MAG: V-type ATP synthase subunit F [Actinobacteria bacterium]|nr:V-type ATP synthase subunit F [Actinomycetota bacterium]